MNKRGRDETTGEAESLWGRINPREFGDQALKTIEEEKLKRVEKLKEKDEKRKKKASALPNKK